jgi:hypothetical protein
MDVILRHSRHVEIDHVSERGDVDAARRDIGRNQHAVFPALEPGQRVSALRLRAVAMDALERSLL